MYEQHFGFTKRPFSLTPDTGLFVNLKDHHRCFSLLTHVLENGEGFLKVIGDVGTGKTILCRKLLKHLDLDENKRFHSVYIPNPMLSPIGLYRAVGHELGLESSQQQDNDVLLQLITQRILALAESNENVIIVVDEAQSLPAPTLEALRLITNLETEEKKLVQIILFGQTELDDLLNQNKFRQLRQRITFSHYLNPLTEIETKQYLEFRLQHCGYNGADLYSKKAIQLLHKMSSGVPRVINVLAHKSLMAAFADYEKIVTDQHIKRAASDSQISTGLADTGTWIIAVGITMLIAAIGWKFL